MTPRKIFGCVSILSGVLLVALAVPEGRLAADIGECCNPAHPAIPTGPPGSDTSCMKDMTTGICKKSPVNQTCTGDAWQQAVPGACETQDYKDCTPNFAPTLVTVKKGHWTCFKDPLIGACWCGWFAYSPEITQNIQVNDCKGDSCP